MQQYQLEDWDLDEVTLEWLDGLAQRSSVGGRSSRTGQGYRNFDLHRAMADIGYRACQPNASVDHLLLYAIVFIFHRSTITAGRPEVLADTKTFLGEAFTHANTLGRSEMARVLMSTTDPATRTGDARPLPAISQAEPSGPQVPAVEAIRGLTGVADRDINAAWVLDPDLIWAVVNEQATPWARESNPSTSSDDHPHRALHGTSVANPAEDTK